MMHEFRKTVVPALIFCLLFSGSALGAPGVLDNTSHINTASPADDIYGRSTASSQTETMQEAVTDRPAAEPALSKASQSSLPEESTAEVNPLTAAGAAQASVPKESTAEVNPLTAASATEASVPEESTAEVTPLTAAAHAEQRGLDGRGGRVSVIRDMRLDNFDREPAFGGGEVRFLENKTQRNQQLCALIRSPEGKLVVVDGGRIEDQKHLASAIREMGGVVDAWLITHPQADHVGGLIGILVNGAEGVEIKNIYYHFLEDEFYRRNDPDEFGTYWVLKSALEELPAERIHKETGRGDVIRLGNELSIRVLNDPGRSSGSFAVNASGLMYDISLSGKHIVITGDMSEAMGDKFLAEGVLEGVRADFVQMAHHGQQGVSESFYKALQPESCIWPTFDDLFFARPGHSRGFRTYETIAWMESMGVKHHYVTVGGDVVLK